MTIGLVSCSFSLQNQTSFHNRNFICFDEKCLVQLPKFIIVCMIWHRSWEKWSWQAFISAKMRINWLYWKTYIKYVFLNDISTIWQGFCWIGKNLNSDFWFMKLPSTLFLCLIFCPVFQMNGTINYIIQYTFDKPVYQFVLTGQCYITSIEMTHFDGIKPLALPILSYTYDWDYNNVYFQTKKVNIQFQLKNYSQNDILFSQGSTRLSRG